MGTWFTSGFFDAVVGRLVRQAVGPGSLEDLEPGAWRHETYAGRVL